MTEARSRNEIVALIAAACIVVGSFMPWAQINLGIGTITKVGTDGDGIITIVLGALAGWLVWDRHSPTAYLAVCALTLVVAVYEILDLGQTQEEIDTGITLGWGLILIVVASIVGIVKGWQLRKG